MDRLSSIDASFLAQEREGSHMHIGGIMIFEGPAPSGDELQDHISSRLHLVPRYRQKLAFPRFEMGRPLWIDDPRFNIGYHVRQTALSAPGTIEQLRLLAARIFSQRLDRSKPLWEIWLVEGLEGGGFALINKTHHCLVDGISGVDLTAVLFDLDREPAEKPAPREEWVPGPEPTEAEIVAEGVRDLVKAPLALAGAPAEDAPQREHWSPPADLLAEHAPGRPQGDQEQPRRDRERRLPGARHRGAAALAARPRTARGRAGAARLRSRLGARRGR